MASPSQFALDLVEDVFLDEYNQGFQRATFGGLQEGSFAEKVIFRDREHGPFAMFQEESSVLNEHLV